MVNRPVRLCVYCNRNRTKNVVCPTCAIGMQRGKYKIILVGEGGVGKTTLVHRLVCGRFLDQRMTIGVQFQVVSLLTTVGNSPLLVDLIIWDLGGQEQFKKTVPNNFLNGACVVMLAFDLTRIKTLNALRYWIKRTKSANKKEVPDNCWVLIGMKSDLFDWRIHNPSKRPMDMFMEDNELEISYITSSKTGNGINEMIVGVTQNLLSSEYSESDVTVQYPISDDSITNSMSNKT